jgi:hypothetical protein
MRRGDRQRIPGDESPKTRLFARGTDGSNPAPSSRESHTNLKTTSIFPVPRAQLRRLADLQGGHVRPGRPPPAATSRTSSSCCRSSWRRPGYSGLWSTDRDARAPSPLICEAPNFLKYLGQIPVATIKIASDCNDIRGHFGLSGVCLAHSDWHSAITNCCRPTPSLYMA